MNSNERFWALIWLMLLTVATVGVIQIGGCVQHKHTLQAQVAAIALQNGYEQSKDYSGHWVKASRDGTVVLMEKDTK